MWSVIPKQDYEAFNSKYMSSFSNMDSQFILSENHTNYFLPRYFYSNFPFPSLKLTKDSKYNSQNINIEFTAELREEQQKLITVVNQILEKNNKINGIIKARPGFGKTVCSAYITCILKKKTLIILDNSKLAEQWKEAFIEFTNIGEENIGIIKGSKFEAKPITITMVQTLVSKTKNGNSDFYKNIRDEGFGLVIFDETHKTSSAPKFALSSLLLNSENILGLSATPFGDELHQLFMNNIIGGIIFESDNYELKPKINFVYYNSGMGGRYYQRVSSSNDYIKQISYYNSIIHMSKSYLELIGKISKKIIETDRKGIVIVQTIKQLETIIEYLETINIRATPLMSDKQDIDKLKDNLIVATYKMASHGFDFAELSCLVLATPLKGRVSLIQTIGRILRLTKNKKQPLVFDLIDCDFSNIFSRSVGGKKKILETEFGECEFSIIQQNI